MHSRNKLWRSALGGLAVGAMTLGLISAPAQAAPQVTPVTVADAAALAAQPDMPPSLDGSKLAQAGSVRGLDKVMTADHANFRDVKTGLKKSLNFNAPKGKPDFKGNKSLKSSKTTIGNKLLTTNYFYGGGYDYSAGDGSSVNLSIVKPYLNTGEDFHSLIEQAAQSADGYQKVEIGTVVSQNINGDLNAHLFVYHWVNDVGTCWNTCGFVAAGGVPASNLPGATMTPGTAPKYGIQHFDGVWWVASNLQWIGYFPDSIWTGATPPVTFTQQGLGQAFTEIASSVSDPCTDMGTGVLGTAGSATAAQINNWSIVNPVVAGASTFDGFGPTPSLPGKFQAALNSGSLRSGRSGGPGYNAAGTGNGTTGSC